MIFLGHLLLFFIVSTTTYFRAHGIRSNWLSATLYLTPIIGCYCFGSWALATSLIATICGFTMYLKWLFQTPDLP
jgi:hypothetical protein